MNPYTLLLAALAAVPAENTPAKYVLKTEDAQTVVAALSYNVSAPKVQAIDWTVVAAAAPELPGQTNVKTVMTPAGSTATELSPLARKVMFASVKANTTALKSGLPIKITYSATLRSRKLEPLADGETAPAVPALPEKTRKLFLAEYGDCDYKNPGFQEWLKGVELTRKKGESDLDYAKRAFLVIRAQFRYEFKANVRRSASTVCTAAKSDCAGLSVLFVAVLRAHGVPARTLYGRWAKSTQPEEKLDGMTYSQWHVKAEFFLSGVGWVPVDISAGWEKDAFTAGFDFFGNDRGDFLVFHVDPNLTIDSKLAGKQDIYSLQLPSYYIRGRGNIEPHKETEDWQVKVEKRDNP
jgi:hypothetical protein